MNFILCGITGNTGKAAYLICRRGTYGFGKNQNYKS
jgi:hypothetical protein